MSDQALVIVVAIGIVVATVAVLALLRVRRRRRLQDRYGSEYDHTVESAGSERAADAELLAREKRHKTLDIKPLGPGARERYADRWAMVQERFVDDPHAAVAEARELVTLVMSDRGYPTDDVDDQQIADELSVEHGRTVSEYRTAAAISARAADGEASTEDLRTAMVHYRALFAELLDSTAEDLSAVSSGHPYQSESTADRSSTGELPDEEAADDLEARENLADEGSAEQRLADEDAADYQADERRAEERPADERPAEERPEDDVFGRPRR
ncbi:MAG TPA: hypothetical protein VHO00_08125 [Actinomycetes bacterium]|jgi:hypothetical protein|nr:hypothetical protein [Actinomycetes bacterium]